MTFAQPMDPASSVPADPASDQTADPVSDETAFDCSICEASIAGEPMRVVNGRAACTSCVAQLQRELLEQRATASVYPLAFAGGLVGALVGAAVWAAISVAASAEVGYVAILVGFLAGYGVKLGARTARGQGLQILAGALAIFGLLAAKYMTIAYIVVDLAKGQGVNMSWFDSRLISMFPEMIKETASPFDVLWIILAVGAAYRVPKDAAVDIL